MGPKKIVARLSEREPSVEWPAPSTVGAILDRRGLIEHRKRRHPPVHPSRMPKKPIAPNDVMTIDYKGHKVFVRLASRADAIARLARFAWNRQQNVLPMFPV